VRQRRHFVFVGESDREHSGGGAGAHRSNTGPRADLEAEDARRQLAPLLSNGAARSVHGQHADRNLVHVPSRSVPADPEITPSAARTHRSCRVAHALLRAVSRLISTLFHPYRSTAVHTSV